MPPADGAKAPNGDLFDVGFATGAANSPDYDGFVDFPKENIA